MPKRVVHLHASRFCNFACQHCYSASGPDQRSKLSLTSIIEALIILKKEGYEVLSLSGGEPLLYSDIQELICSAADLGFRVNLITNGTPVSGQILDTIAQHVSIVAISLDGSPEIHAKFRNHQRAFHYAERAMDCLAANNVAFGISYCVSKESLIDMPWVVEFGQQKGATLIQFHLLGITGRGKSLAHIGLDNSDKARAYVTATLLENRNGPAIHLDLIPTEIAYTRREDYSILRLESAQDKMLSDLVNPLVIDESGRILPLSYGINYKYEIGKMNFNIPSSIEQYKKEKWCNLKSLINQAFSQLNSCQDDFVDWFQYLVDRSYECTMDASH